MPPALADIKLIIKMKNSIVITCCLWIGLSVLATCPAYSSGGTKQSVELNNGYLKIVFDKHTGEIAEMMYPKDPGAVIVSRRSVKKSPWEIALGKGAQAAVVDIQSAGSFSYRKTGNRMELKWSRFKKLPSSFKVVVNVELLPDSAMSVWDIYLAGTQNLLVNKVTFPRIAGIGDMGNEELAVPEWMGSLLHAPRAGLKSRQAGSRRFSWTYPGALSMQFVALYNPERYGLYFSSDDSLAFSKDFFLSMDDKEQLVYGVDHFPSHDTRQPAYRPGYKCLVGVFKGDWITAAKMYKNWGIQQSWSRNSRLKKGKVPQWLQNTGYWEWNRGYASNVLPPATSLQK